MTEATKVLDHGHVRLVDTMGSDLSVVRSARVSYDAAWRSGEDEGKDERLIRYLMRNGHTSPFESAALTFDIKAPIFVLRQWHRHRTWSFNEVSARYTELPEEFYAPEPDQLTGQAESSKQARNDHAVDGADVLAYQIKSWNSDAFRHYKYLLKQGVARELARTVLPVATYSQMFATVNLHNFMRFCRLRIHPHAQYEIRVYAEAMLDLASANFPVSISAFEESQS